MVSSFQEAFNDYRNELFRKPKKRQFIGDIELSNGNASAEELQEAVEDLVKQCENKKLRQFWRKYLTPVVNGLDELSGVIGGTGTAIYLLSKEWIANWMFSTSRLEHPSSHAPCHCLGWSQIHDGCE